MATFAVLEEYLDSIVQLFSLADAIPFDHDDEESVEYPIPRRCFCCSVYKVDYIRQNWRVDKVCMDAIYLFNANMFTSITVTTSPEFESLFQAIVKFIIRLIDAELTRTEEEEVLRVPRKNALFPHTMLFFFYICFVAGSRGACVLSICHFGSAYRTQRYLHISFTSQNHYLTPWKTKTYLSYNGLIRKKCERCGCWYMALKIVLVSLTGPKNHAFDQDKSNVKNNVISDTKNNSSILSFCGQTCTV